MAWKCSVYELHWLTWPFGLATTSERKVGSLEKVFFSKLQVL